jgi:hypothetical protein
VETEEEKERLGKERVPEAGDPEFPQPGAYKFSSHSNTISILGMSLSYYIIMFNAFRTETKPTAAMRSDAGKVFGHSTGSCGSTPTRRMSALVSCISFCSMQEASLRQG